MKSLFMFFVMFTTAYADNSKLIVFCLNGKSDYDEMCAPYKKLTPSIYKNLEIITIPEEIRYKESSLKNFFCNTYKKENSPRIVTLLSSHGTATGTAENYMTTDRESGREVRGNVNFYIGTTSELANQKGINGKIMVDLINQCQEETKKQSLLIFDSCHSGAICKVLSSKENKSSLETMGVLSTCLDCDITDYFTFVDLLLKNKKNCKELDKNGDGIISAQEYTDFIHKTVKFGEHKENTKPGKGVLDSVTRPSLWAGNKVPLYAGSKGTQFLFSCPESMQRGNRNLVKEPEPQHYNTDGYNRQN